MTQSGDEHNRLYQAGVDLVWPHLPLHGKPGGLPDENVHEQMRTGIAHLLSAIALKPDNWSAMWIVAMAHRRLGENEAALEWFARSLQFSGENPDVPREAGLTAMTMGRFDRAIEYTSRAIHLKPHDAGLQANLALAHLLNGDPGAAHDLASRALAADPTDAITRRIVDRSSEVLDGKRPCPRSIREL